MTQKGFLCLVIFFSLSAFPVPADSNDTLPAIQKQTDCSVQNLHLSEGVKISEKLYGLSGIDNVGRLSPCVYRGNQPSSGGYKTLRKMGIKTVINLRASHGEKEAVETAGMKYLAFPLSMGKEVQQEKIKQIVSAIANPENQPVYIHCALGQDRTGIVVAAYRMDVNEWSFKEAEKEMQSFGFNDAWIHLKKSLVHYAKKSGKVL